MNHNQHNHHFAPMQAAGAQHLIERVYRESGTFQWVRELQTNALESGATRIEYGVEWQAVESKGVYRRTIIDNGKGMTADELQQFFNTFGGGGKAIGGVHENFGVGSKTSLLPWNHHGVVVVSRVDGEDAMIWIQRDPKTGEYGLKRHECEDPDTGAETLELACAPDLDDEHGCDWSKVLPDWVGQSGTAIILLGNQPTQDTVLGDPNRKEQETKGISSYLNRRFWQFGEEVEVFHEELRSKNWPRTAAEAHGPQPLNGPDRRVNRRKIWGARHFIHYPKQRELKGKLAHQGSVRLQDGTEVDWFLWSGDRPSVHMYAAKSGYLAAIYKGELYDVSAHHNTYRSFGISEPSVRQRVWLIVRPPMLDEDELTGVYPRTDRNKLLMRGGPDAGKELPFHDWGAEFSEQMPTEIAEALRDARTGTGGSIEDEGWLQRMAARLFDRWRVLRRKKSAGGTQTVDSTGAGGNPRKQGKKKRPCKKRAGGGKGGTKGRPSIGKNAGKDPAKQAKVAGSIPTYRYVHGDAIEQGLFVAWQPNDPEAPEGVVLLATDFPVLVEQIRYWQDQYASHQAEAVEDVVRQVYGEVAVAKIAHTEHLKGSLPSDLVEQQLRSPAALTTALLGLLAEETLIEQRLRHRFTRRRQVG